MSPWAGVQVPRPVPQPIVASRLPVLGGTTPFAAGV